MPKVQALNETLIRQIAAGEVVERPASIVKELLENAIDAGASKITLEVTGSGKEMIRISDNGCGMSAQDAKLALERHTTSKIRTFEDLEFLDSFGFRGEALPSIGSVSKLELLTCDENEGTKITVEGGKIVEEAPASRAQGTTFTIKDLFFNTPARQKFLKSDTTERARILRTFEEIAIAHAQIAFTYQSEARTVVELAARQDGLQRLIDLWGKSIDPLQTITLNAEHPFIHIRGWVSSPQSSQTTKNYQIFYVNNRPIISRSLSHALYDAYRDCLPVSRHPLAIIFITLASDQVDVNVHPAKREVRFKNEGQIYEALLKEIRLKRTQFSVAPSLLDQNFSQEQKTILPQNLDEKLNSAYQNLSQNFKAVPLKDYFKPTSFSAPLQKTQTLPSAQQTEHFSATSNSKLDLNQVLSQFSSVYALVEREGNLVIVDQHAASERILYEKYKQSAQENKTATQQKLLIPFLWNVTLSQSEILKDYEQTFKKVGFDLESFGEKTYRVSAIPSDLKESDLQETLEKILKDLTQEKDPVIAQDALLKRAACRAAIKAGDKLTNLELRQLLQELALCDNPHTCPHGRPTTLTITRYELDKKFGRLYSN